MWAFCWFDPESVSLVSSCFRRWLRLIIWAEIHVLSLLISPPSFKRSRCVFLFRFALPFDVVAMLIPFSFTYWRFKLFLFIAFVGGVMWWYPLFHAYVAMVCLHPAQYADLAVLLFSPSFVCWRCVVLFAQRCNLYAGAGMFSWLASRSHLTVFFTQLHLLTL